jgi:2-dehydro-3-deoxyphosphogluconate aldolase/(4S)-4-hydroxy-2-oxoglutarate aldolase
LFGFEIAHLGINCSDIYEAKKNAEIFCGIFNFDMKEGRSSFFAGNGIEIVKRKYLGTYGHIAFKTDNIDAAVEYLRLKGYGFIWILRKEMLK